MDFNKRWDLAHHPPPPRIAIKAQAMGEMVSASRLLITECLQSWKPELKILGNPNLNASRPHSVLFCPQSRNLPWCFGRTLQPCCAGVNGCSAGEHPKDAKPLYPGQGERHRSRRRCEMEELLHTWPPFIALLWPSQEADCCAEIALHFFFTAGWKGLGFFYLVCVFFFFP